MVFDPDGLVGAGGFQQANSSGVAVISSTVCLVGDGGVSLVVFGFEANGCAEPVTTEIGAVIDVLANLAANVACEPLLVLFWA